MNTLLEEFQILNVPDADAVPKEEAHVLPQGRLLSELVRPVVGNDPDELLRSRYLSKGGGLLFCGPTGIGKSALGVQCAILWALGRECFGIAPARPLNSLLIQAENDDGDLAEMRDGVVNGLSLSADEEKAACNQITVVREDTHMGSAFFGLLRQLLATHKPDLLWIDPAFAYIGGNASAQEAVSAFLRNGLNPLLHEFGCGCVIVHHTNKPPSGSEKPSWQASDFAYLGSGSAEWANWARAVMAMRSIGSHHVFELRAGKRGARLGWRDGDGVTKAYVKYIAHAKEPGVICWRDADPGELPQVGGRHKACSADELLHLLPPEGLHAGDWVRKAKEDLGVSEGTLHNNRRMLVEQKRIFKSEISGKWQPVRSRAVR